MFQEMIKSVPLTKSVWPQFIELFGGEEGGCGGCWCTWWRMSRKEWYQYTKAERRAIMEGLVVSGEPTGILLLNEKEAEGWCAIAPMSSYPALARSRICYPIDETPAWYISCIFVKAPYRRQGKMETLIYEAAKYAFSQGAVAVDGFPQLSGKTGVFIDRFVGVEGSFLRAGFKRIEMRGECRVAVRKVRKTR